MNGETKTTVIVGLVIVVGLLRRLDVCLSGRFIVCVCLSAWVYVCLADGLAGCVSVSVCLDRCCLKV